MTASMYKVDSHALLELATGHNNVDTTKTLTVLVPLVPKNVTTSNDS